MLFIYYDTFYVHIMLFCQGKEPAVELIQRFKVLRSFSSVISFWLWRTKQVAMTNGWWVLLHITH